MRSIDYLSLVRLVLALTGVGLIGFGGWLAWEPLGFLLPGILLVVIAIVGDLRAGLSKPRGGSL